MTKLKTKKKMNKSTIAIIVMAVVMVAMLAFGGTYAYFTATSASRVSKFKVGTVALKSNATFKTVDKNVVPGDVILDNATISYINESNVNTYIAVVFDVLYEGKYFTCTSAASGTGAGRTEATWELRQTARPLNLSAAHIKEAFVDSFDISNANTIIEKDLWEQGGQGTGYDFRNVYLQGSANDFIVDAPINADKSMKPAADRTTAFINNKTAKITTGLNRRYWEVVFDRVETGAQVTENTKTVMEIPSKNGSDEWKVGDVYLAWEDADVTIQFTAYQIQADFIGASDESLSATADFNTVWNAMKEKVGYTGTITYMEDATVENTDYTKVAAETASSNEPYYIIK